MPDSKEHCLAGDVNKFLDGRGIELVRKYFDPAAQFSGASFGRFAGGGDAVGHRYAFTAEDLVAVTLLDVSVPGQAALEILDKRSSEFNALLAEVPYDLDLWDAPASVVDDSSPAAILWDSLRKLPDMGPAKTHKLMARKRPRLLPVFDSVVKKALQPHRRSVWLPFWYELQDETLIARLAEIHEAAGLDEQIPLLRVLDVAVWMRNRKKSKWQLAFTPCPKWS
jgi:hypothetical protein